MRHQDPPRAPEPNASTTAPAHSTARPLDHSRAWAVHWVYPRAEILPLVEDATTLGRDPGCGYVLNDEQVSRHHASFVVRGASCRVVDHESSNGVSVDGSRVREVSLTDGSVVRCGSTVGVVVYAPGAALPEQPLATFEGQAYVGSCKLARVVAAAQTLAPLSDAVLVHGGSGSGKEALAELLHRASRRTGRYVALNCARLQPNLAGSELFGHVRGAFSGAEREHVGAAAAADRGTLFLDEVAELAPDVQAQLLRFLESGEVTPVGSVAKKRASTRVVAATHRDLRALSATGRFREDLYYRLSVQVLEVPALKERREDILGLFERFAGRSRAGLSPGFVVELLLAEWPGNVRELKNLAARLRAAHAGEPVWSRHLLPGERGSEPPRDAGERRVTDARTLTREDWLALSEAHGGVAARIARATNLPATTVKRHLKLHGVKR